MKLRRVAKMAVYTGPRLVDSLCRDNKTNLHTGQLVPGRMSSLSEETERIFHGQMADRSKSSAENVERKLSRGGLKRTWIGSLSPHPCLVSRIYIHETGLALTCTCVLINFTENVLRRFIKSDNKGDVEIRPIKQDFPMCSVCCKIQTVEN